MDTVQKTWQHLNFFEHECHLHARVPRIKRDDGKVRLIPNSIRTLNYNLPTHFSKEPLFGGKKKKRRVRNNRVNSNELVYTPVDDLMYGMYVSKLDIPWLESPFKFQGFSIATDHDLHTLREICQYVYIDITKQGFPIQQTQCSYTTQAKVLYYISIITCLSVQGY
jgi:hypothetical protein